MLEKIDGSDTSDTSEAKKPRRRSVVKYPATVSVAVTGPMLNSILRLCPKNSPDNQSAYLRRLLHQMLLAVDPLYVEEMAEPVKPNGHDQGGNNA